MFRTIFLFLFSISVTACDQFGLGGQIEKCVQAQVNMEMIRFEAELKKDPAERGNLLKIIEAIAREKCLKAASGRD
jgi:hypothetical protein